MGFNFGLFINFCLIFFSFFFPISFSLNLVLAKLSQEPCASCPHSLLSHISHCEKVADTELNKLVNTAIDVESLILFLHIEPDPDTKHVYFYLYKLLRKSLASMISPTVESPLGNPPFEEPSILKVCMI